MGTQLFAVNLFESVCHELSVLPCSQALFKVRGGGGGGGGTLQYKWHLSSAISGLTSRPD